MAAQQCHDCNQKRESTIDCHHTIIDCADAYLHQPTLVLSSIDKTTGVSMVVSRSADYQLHGVDQRITNYMDIRGRMQEVRPQEDMPVGSVDAIVVSGASVHEVNGIYKKAERRSDGVAMYHKQDDAPEGMVYALFRSPTVEGGFRRKWYLGLVPLSGADVDCTIFYCTRKVLGSSEQEISFGLGDWNVPPRYEWKAMSANDDVGDEDNLDHGRPPQVRVHTVDVDTDNVRDDVADDLVHIVVPLHGVRRDIRPIMRALLEGSRVQLHLARPSEDNCPVCLHPFNENPSDNVVVAQIRNCGHRLHFFCLEGQLMSSTVNHFCCPICRGEI